MHTDGIYEYGTGLSKHIWIPSEPSEPTVGWRAWALRLLLAAERVLAK